MIESDMERRMTSIAPECNDAKRSYDDCFNQWFHNTYMRQRESTHVSPIVQSNPCNHLLKVYLSCVIKVVCIDI
jgi:TRIAP1/MDM35 family protein